MPEEAAEVKEKPEFVTHFSSARKAVRSQWESLIPDEFWQHRRAARREMLLAFRSLVDSAIERIDITDDKEEPAPTTPKKPRTTRKAKTKIEVEGDEGKTDE